MSSAHVRLLLCDGCGRSASPPEYEYARRGRGWSLWLHQNKWTEAKTPDGERHYCGECWNPPQAVPA